MAAESIKMQDLTNEVVPIVFKVVIDCKSNAKIYIYHFFIFWPISLHPIIPHNVTAYLPAAMLFLRNLNFNV